MSSKKPIAVDKTDFKRALLTETLPDELPIVFSNEGFYHWMKSHLPTLGQQGVEGKVADLVNALVSPVVTKSPTVPLRFRVAQGSYRTRDLHLLHPRSQNKWVECYEQYSGLLIYYCGRSTWSIRAPYRIAAHVFAPDPWHDPNAKAHRLSQITIDTAEDDRRLRHPGSFFAYRGHQRLHAFFDSQDFLELEQRYRVLWTMDIENCFGSIYTHSVGWAVKSKAFEKQNINSKETFASRLDSTMAHGNWAETNGIPVGPEASRIFAEVILQDVDVRVSRELVQDNLAVDVRRYVDDYFLFARSDSDAQVVAGKIAGHLKEYGLRLNQAKTVKYQRPFATPRSRVLAELQSIVRALEEFLYEPLPPRPQGAEAPAVPQNSPPVVSAAVPPASSAAPGASHDSATPSAAPEVRADRSHEARVPRRTDGRSHLLTRRKLDFIREIRSASSSLGTGYDFVALYVLGALERHVLDMSSARALDPRRDADYRRVFVVLLELAFALFAFEPTAAASLKVANISLQALHLFRHSGTADTVREVEETVFEACVSFLAHGGPNPELSDEPVSVERLNVLAILSQLPSHRIPWATVRTWLFRTRPGVIDLHGSSSSDARYFQLVVCLHYANLTQDADALTELQESVRQTICNASSSDLIQRSGLVHLLLDALSCPFLNLDVRIAILRKVCDAAGVHVAQPDEVGMLAILSENRWWFTDWREISLMRGLERKKRTSVY